MCRPQFFAVDYVINPWMAGNLGQLDLQRAQRQWARLRDALAEHVQVHELPPEDGLPDMVFTANAGLSIGANAVPSHFMPLERRGEEVHFKRWFRSQGFTLYDLPDKVGFEGQGDCLLDSSGEWLWTSAGPRTEATAYAHLARCFDREVLTLKLVDPRFYHIDTCLTVLENGWLMYFPAAFDAESLRKIESRVGKHKRIVVSEADAGQFACNAVNLGSDIFLHAVSDPLRQQLATAGFSVHQHALDEFLKAGGSAKCLTLLLYELPGELPVVAGAANSPVTA
jgi:N-dimethylarginine dimethylaminohydrolase